MDIEGVTDPGQFAPIVKVRAVHKHRHRADSRPAPGFLSGSDHRLARRPMGGNLRGRPPLPGAVHTNGEIWRAVIAANGGVMSVRCPMPRDPLIQEDAEVRVQAVCLYQFNQKRQALTPVLQVPAGVKSAGRKTRAGQSICRARAFG